MKQGKKGLLAWFNAFAKEHNGNVTSNSKLKEKEGRGWNEPSYQIFSRVGVHAHPDWANRKARLFTRNSQQGQTNAPFCPVLCSSRRFQQEVMPFGDVSLLKVTGPCTPSAPTIIGYHRSIGWYWHLRNATHHWSALGHWAIDYNSLSATIQSIPYPPSGPSIKSMCLQFRDKGVMWDTIKCFPRVSVDARRYVLTHSNSSLLI